MISKRDLIATIIVFGIVITLLLVTECGKPVQAAELWPQWDEDARLDLARCIYAECSLNTPEESAAIAHVLVKTWRDRFRNRGWSVNETLRKYCAVFDRGGVNYHRPRTRDIRESTWKEPLHGKPEQWEWLRDFVGRFVARRVQDPCPVATIWRGRTDIRKEHWTCPCRFTERGNEFCHVQR